VARKLCILVAVLVPALPAGAAHAATFTVNSVADEVDLTPGDNVCLTQTGVCTLRAATQQTNASAGDDVIDLPSGDYQLAIGGADEDASATGDLDLAPSGAAPERVTISGAGARTTRIIGVAGDRVLQWTDDNLTVDISGVTITGGSGADFGAGIDGGGTFTLTNVAVTGNHADNPATLHNQGGGIFNQGGMTLVNVTLSGNSASGPGNPQGGGLFDLGNAGSSLTNVTMSGNSVATTSGGNPQGGGYFYLTGTGSGITATLRNVTIAGNTTGGTQGGGLYTLDPISLGNTIIALNRTAGAAVSNCAGGGGDSVISLGHNLDEGNDCNFTAGTDLRNTDPLLGPLQDNGGQLDTRALLLGSPAIDTGDPAACPATDARGVARPSGAGCDIGAFEFFVPPPPPPDNPTAELGREFVAQVVRGTVKIASRLRGPYIPLGEATEIPVGSFFDTRHGTVHLTAAVNAAGKTQSGNFSRGLFQAVQSRKRSAKGLTELRLKGGSFGRCGKSRRAAGDTAGAALSRRTIRRLRSSARGRFRTSGRNRSATVRGTIWEMSDRCDGTLTKVTRGKVAVRDFRRKKTVLVRAGKSYLAKSRR
jgi:CSLREA domain-containing protein